MTREELLEKRRSEFEKWLSSKIESPAPEIDFEKDPDGEYVYEPAISDWQAWNAALDSVEIDLPDESSGRGDYAAAYDSGIDDCRRAIEAQGLKVKP